MNKDLINKLNAINNQAFSSELMFQEDIIQQYSIPEWEKELKFMLAMKEYILLRDLVSTATLNTLVKERRAFIESRKVFRFKPMFYIDNYLDIYSSVGNEIIPKISRNIVYINNQNLLIKRHFNKARWRDCSKNVIIFPKEVELSILVHSSIQNDSEDRAEDIQHLVNNRHKFIVDNIATMEEKIKLLTEQGYSFDP